MVLDLTVDIRMASFTPSTLEGLIWFFSSPPEPDSETDRFHAQVLAEHQS
jgi:hypothetical protein